MSVYLRFPGGRDRVLTLSYDDGLVWDGKLIGIMRQHGLRGTFNINTGLFVPDGTVYPDEEIHRVLSHSEAKDTYRDSGMELAVHGKQHLWWTNISDSALIAEIVQDRRTIEDMFGGIVRGAAYPFGIYNSRTEQALRAAGIVYCRTGFSTNRFDIPGTSSWLHLGPTCHHDSPRLSELADRFVQMPESALPQMFFLYGHTYEFFQHDNWDVIEHFAEQVGGHGHIWYATNIEIYDYLLAFERLETSLDGKRIHNPNACTVWFKANGKTLSVAPGETVTL